MVDGNQTLFEKNLLSDLSRATLGHGRDYSIVENAGDCPQQAKPGTA
jgi:hypothetical protein